MVTSMTTTNSFKRNPFNWRKVIKNVNIVLGIFILLIVVLFPFYWLVFSSVKVLTDLFQPNVFFPWDTKPNSFNLTFDNYEYAINEANPSVVSMFINSLYIAIISTILTLIISTLGAYAVARMKFRGKSTVTNSILLIYTFPGIIMIIPIFVLFSRLGLAGNVQGLIIAYLAQTTPVALYMLAGYFQTIPAEIEEAALMDGCSRFEVIRKITLPLSLPAIASISLFVFMIVWNEYLFARTFLLQSSRDYFTLAVGLQQVTASGHAADWGGILAVAMILLTPVMILYLLAEKYMVRGLTAGAVKG
ncbi:MAG: carbohydrate ABC transporter permease [Candidatus Hodarchaeales archaeon]|jgi:multiple sugar transport system permease protein